MSLLTITQLRAEVKTGLDNTNLQVIIDREEEQMVERLGAHYAADTTVAETHAVRAGCANVYLRRRLSSVASITERDPGGTSATVAATDYEVWAAQGRIERVSGAWKARVTVTYQPTDDSARRRQALVALIRLILERTAMKAESIAGEFSYTAADWDVERATIYRNIGFMEA